MRSMLIFVALSWGCCGMLRAQEAQLDSPREDARIEAAERVEFNGTTLTLAWEDGNDDHRTREYIPAGETLERWTKLAAIYEYVNIDDPRALAEALARQLNARKPPAPNDVIVNDKNGEVIVDFIVTPEGNYPPDETPFIEFNIFKYSKRNGGGVIAQQFAMRAYKDLRGFMRDLAVERPGLLTLMSDQGLRLIGVPAAGR